MPYALLAGLLALGVFIGMVILQEVGRRVGHRRMARDPEGARAGVGAIDGAVFGLLGLLVAFTFSGAASTFPGNHVTGARRFTGRARRQRSEPRPHCLCSSLSPTLRDRQRTRPV